MELFDQIAQVVENGDEEETKKLVQQALDNQEDPLSIIDGALMKGMGVVGDKFGKGEMFIPEVMIAAQALQAGIEIINPHLQEGQRSYIGKVVIGTVAGDIHDLGKNLVKMMLSANGFEVIDLGVDLPEEKFVEAVEKEKPQILGMSALLTTTMPEMKKVIDTLQEKGLRDQVQVILGGAPVNQEFADKIGADLYAEDALEAVNVLKKVLS